MPALNLTQKQSRAGGNLLKNWERQSESKKSRHHDILFSRQ